MSTNQQKQLLSTGMCVLICILYVDILKQEQTYKVNIFFFKTSPACSMATTLPQFTRKHFLLFLHIVDSVYHLFCCCCCCFNYDMTFTLVSDSPSRLSLLLKRPAYQFLMLIKNGVRLGMQLSRWNFCLQEALDFISSSSENQMANVYNLSTTKQRQENQNFKVNFSDSLHRLFKASLACKKSFLK